MQTRNPAIVALIAAVALVAGAAPALSRQAGPSRFEDPASLRRVALPVAGALVATPTLAPTAHSAGRLPGDAVLREPGAPVRAGRPAVDLPAASPVAVVVPPPPPRWRLDPEVSWYGPGFYGNRIACGLAYTTAILGVAHRTLPCGTLVSFRNPRNGRTATVPVIDRGPYVDGRTWDLSGGLCVLLDHCWTGPLEWRLP